MLTQELFITAFNRAPIFRSIGHGFDRGIFLKHDLSNAASRLLFSSTARFVYCSQVCLLGSGLQRLTSSALNCVGHPKATHN